ncbi:MAG: hypothetical protein SGILL_005425 [Bacillariaceae sp.]
MASASSRCSSEPSFVRGRIIRKRKHQNGVGYAIKPFDSDGAATAGSVEQASFEVSSGTGNDGNQPQSQQKPKTIPPVLVLVPRNHPSIKWCFVGAVVHVDLKKTVVEESSFTNEINANTDNNSKNKGNRKNLRDAERVELIQCSPDPNAIVHCLDMVVKGDLALESFPTIAIQNVDQVKQLLAASPKDEGRRKTILQISRHLQAVGDNPASHYLHHHPGAKKYGTSNIGQRTPRIKRRYWYVLEEMEKKVPVIKPLQNESLASTEIPISRGLNVQALQQHMETQAIPAEEICMVSAPSSANGKDEAVMMWNVPNVHAMSNNHPISRLDYLKQKKFPQVRWLLQKLQYVMKHIQVSSSDNDDATTDTNETPRKVRVLDVGGGRGDLAVAMAQAFPNLHVTVVDVNESSLRAGKSFAEHTMGQKLADEQTTFHCADFVSFAKDMAEKCSKTMNAFDVVVAWHACGDLSDFALEFAIDISASFIICPCCFTKRYIEGFEPKWIGDFVGGNSFLCQEISKPPLQAPEPLTGTMEKDIQAVQRIAEINEHNEASRRAMLLVNSMRLISLEREQDYLHRSPDSGEAKVDTSSITSGGLVLTLEEYDRKHSSKNFVLVGVQK